MSERGPASVAVCSIASGRHAHLERQLWGLRRQTRAPDLVVVASMGDPGLADVVAHGAAPGWRTAVPSVPVPVEGLPLAAARNVAAAAAIASGAHLLVFLDVDCIPSPGLVARYAAALHAARELTARGPVVLSGEVAYLPEVEQGQDYRDLDLDGLAEPHPGRPVLAPSAVEVAQDVRLFWSLSFAVTAADWVTLGGFDERYVGYGAEDTDFGQRLEAAGGSLVWVGGARAHHQHHPTSSPPVQHLQAVVTNANRFAAQWGWFPMETWLRAFEERGLARWSVREGRWEVAARH